MRGIGVKPPFVVNTKEVAVFYYSEQLLIMCLAAANIWASSN